MKRHQNEGIAAITRNNNQLLKAQRYIKYNHKKIVRHITTTTKNYKKKGRTKDISTHLAIYLKAGHKARNTQEVSTKCYEFIVEFPT